MKLRNQPVVICRVQYRAEGAKGARNWNKGDMVAIPAHEAASYAGFVEVLTKPVLPSDVRAAGGVIAYIAANPAQEFEKGSTASAIASNPGRTARNPEYEGIDLVPDPELDDGLLKSRRVVRRQKQVQAQA